MTEKQSLKKLQKWFEEHFGGLPDEEEWQRLNKELGDINDRRGIITERLRQLERIFNEWHAANDTRKFLTHKEKKQ